MEAKQRKNYLDNIRWITILIVVVYHVFYYYKNLGTTPMFEGLHETTGVTFSAVFQYAVYQWFMVLLFIVSGICARYTLEKKTVKQFIKSKVLNLPIAVYRMCYYPMAFLLGYFVFSHEKILNDLKKFWYVFMTIGIIFGVVTMNEKGQGCNGIWTIGRTFCSRR